MFHWDLPIGPISRVWAPTLARVDPVKYFNIVEMVAIQQHAKGSMWEAPATRTPPTEMKIVVLSDRMRLTHHYSVVQERGEHAQFDVAYVLYTVTVTYCSYLFAALTSTRVKTV